MKKIYLMIFAVVLAAACESQMPYGSDFEITLDKDNTYVAGEPVRFNFNGDADNLLFYSGETGSQYKFKDRYEVGVDAVIAANLSVEYMWKYGFAKGMDVYISNEFKGLTGSDGNADRQTIKEMWEGGMQGWIKLEYDDTDFAEQGKWVSKTYDISSCMDNFTLAFHWSPKDGEGNPTFSETQRTYLLRGGLTLDLDGMDPSSTTFEELGFVTVMMNEELDPYHRNAGNGSIRTFDDTKNPLKEGETFRFQGVGANVKTYPLDGWIISTPTPLNKVANDKGSVVKNIENYLHTFEYTWDEPGTYVVTFVGRSANYSGASETVRTMNINIVAPKLEK